MHSFIRIQTKTRTFCFTDADEDIEYNNELYRSGGFITPNRILSSNELAEDKFTITGAMLNEEMIEGFLEIFVIKNNEKLVLKTGWIGEVKFDGGKFIASINTLSSKAKNIIGKCYSSGCRAEFGDQFCKKDKEKYSFEGEVSELSEDNSFVDSNRNEPNGYFNDGKLEFQSGENLGKLFHILLFNEEKIFLEEKIKLAVGDKYRITVGCDKSLSTCIAKFNNAINFRGEPFIPNGIAK